MLDVHHATNGCCSTKAQRKIGREIIKKRRNLQARKKGPWHRQALTGCFSSHVDASPTRRRKQSPPQGPHKALSLPANHPEGFSCAWCGNFSPWSRMAAFDAKLKFCQVCYDAMEALETGTGDALAILREGAR